MLISYILSAATCVLYARCQTVSSASAHTSQETVTHSLTPRVLYTGW